MKKSVETVPDPPSDVYVNSHTPATQARVKTTLAGPIAPNVTDPESGGSSTQAAVAVPPLKAVVMLCDGAITFLQKALDAHEAKRFEEGHAHLTRATAILRGLSHNLDVTRGLDPRVHPTIMGICRWMDARIKSAHDGVI